MTNITSFDSFASMDDVQLPDLNKKDFDLTIIGSGPAGQKAAISAAKEGAKVALIERDPLAGGVCLNTGTIPSKTLREAVLYLTGYRQRGMYGEDYRVKDKITSLDLLERTAHVIRLERDVINRGLDSNGVVRLVGTGKVTGPHEVSLQLGGSESKVKTDKILIAVGTIPRRPKDVPFDNANVFDSDSVFGTANELRPLPDSIIILGAGVIGIEYASMFGALGIPTILVDNRPDPLSFVDNEISGLLYKRLEFSGVKICFNVDCEEIKVIGKVGDPSARVSARLSDGSTEEADGFLFAQGRIPVTQSLGLTDVGVILGKRGHIEVDENYCTNMPSIYAAGDVIGFPSLASTSAEQGRVAALNAIGKPVTWHPELIPYGIYTIPEISMVGKTEEQLKEEDVPYVVGTGLWRETARGKILGDITGALKLIFHRESERLLGVHIIGEGATELLHIGQAVMHYKGGPEYFINSVFNYPTLAEAYKIAAFNATNRLAGHAISTTSLMDQVYEGGTPAEWAKWSL